jgi:phage-related protein
MVHYGLGPASLKRLPAYFYRSDGGREPVRVWLKVLQPEDRKVIGEDIKDVEFSWPIGMPLVRSLGRELWEVRSSLLRGRIARVIFCVEQGRMVLLHGFIKKTQKTPQRDIDLALRRKKGGSE